MTETKKEFLRIINVLESRDLEESQISELLDQIVELFAENEDEAITLVNELDENQAAWLVTTFEELAFVFQNNDFIEAVESLSRKYPDIPGIQGYVTDAKHIMAS